MLNKNVAEFISKYSFIDKCEVKGITFYIYYTKDGQIKFKKLPLRATIPMLQKTINSIRTELGVSKYGIGQRDFYIVETN